MKVDARLALLIGIDDGEVDLVATDPDDDCTITDRINVGRDGTKRRIDLLKALCARDGYVLQPGGGKKKR